MCAVLEDALEWESAIMSTFLPATVRKNLQLGREFQTFCDVAERVHDLSFGFLAPMFFGAIGLALHMPAHRTFSFAKEDRAGEHRPDPT
jgi:hypothetical protein